MKKGNNRKSGHAEKKANKNGTKQSANLKIIMLIVIIIIVRILITEIIMLIVIIIIVRILITERTITIVAEITKTTITII